VRVGHGMGVHDGVGELLEFGQAEGCGGLGVAPCAKVLTHALIQGAAPSSASTLGDLHDHGCGGEAIAHTTLREGLLLLLRWRWWS